MPDTEMMAVWSEFMISIPEAEIDYERSWVLLPPETLGR
jgi:hypothetical protein